MKDTTIRFMCGLESSSTPTGLVRTLKQMLGMPSTPSVGTQLQPTVECPDRHEEEPQFEPSKHAMLEDDSIFQMFSAVRAEISAMELPIVLLKPSKLHITELTDRLEVSILTYNENCRRRERR